MPILIFQDVNGNDIAEHEVSVTAPDIVCYNNVYFKRHFLTKSGGAHYRPATLQRIVSDSKKGA